MAGILDCLKKELQALEHELGDESVEVVANEDEQFRAILKAVIGFNPDSKLTAGETAELAAKLFSSVEVPPTVDRCVRNTILSLVGEQKGSSSVSASTLRSVSGLAKLRLAFRTNSSGSKLAGNEKLEQALKRFQKKLQGEDQDE